ncbi:putative serine peptidase [Phyllosticta capitalensis]
MKRLSLIGLAGLAAANVIPKELSLNRPPKILDATINAANLGSFEQLIDHDNPSLGTFSQRFWYSDEFWAGPGSPVVFFTPGEVEASGYTGYLTNRTITGLFAEAIGGAVVMMEHRYWGQSSPYDELTTKNLQYLTLEQSIKDTTHFAKTVALPFDTNGSSNAANAPWVFSGGSYSGALSAWTQAKDPGTFWAYHASSAVVQAIDDFWQYFVPVEAGMPTNCSADVSLVISHIDGILLNGTSSQKKSLKKKFGLEALTHDDDFASALENGPWLWQSNTFYSGYSAFYEFCDYVENAAGSAANGSVPGAEGVGVEKALSGYAEWMREVLVPGYCANYGYWNDNSSLACFDTYNASSPLFTDVSVDNAIDRQWQWFLCNEPFAFWQDGAPASRNTSIVSRLVTASYWQRQCGLFFPSEGNFTYGSARGLSVDDVNAYTGGWDMNTTRVLWVNGQYDPWKDATVSSDFKPGGPLQSTSEAPVMVIPDGIHCSDLIAQNGAVNDGVQDVIDAEVKQIKAWVAEWPGTKYQQATASTA